MSNVYCAKIKLSSELRHFPLAKKKKRKEKCWDLSKLKIQSKF